MLNLIATRNSRNEVKVMNGEKCYLVNYDPANNQPYMITTDYVNCTGREVHKTIWCVDNRKPMSTLVGQLIDAAKTPTSHGQWCNCTKCKPE